MLLLSQYIYADLSSIWQRPSDQHKSWAELPVKCTGKIGYSFVGETEQLSLFLTLIGLMVKLTPAVNFINVKRAHFLYENVTRKSCRNAVHTKNSYVKMLMKLTPAL